MAARGRAASAVIEKKRKPEPSRIAPVGLKPVVREKKREKNSVAERSEDFITIKSETQNEELEQSSWKEICVRPGSRDEVLSMTLHH
ncbi:MAG: hypothetical protein ACLPHP_19865 [Candidatus Sulfotelmatobacter sp.]